MATRDEVVGFLNLFKGCLMLDRVNVHTREKNAQAMWDLRMTSDDRTRVLMSLEPEDYVDGPKPDDTDIFGKEVWEFGKSVSGIEIYMKLRVMQAPQKRGVYHAFVWSFHPAQYPMRYPLRRGGA